MWNAMSDQYVCGLLDGAAQPFRHFRFAAGADGAMWVSPRSQRLDSEEIQGLAALLRAPQRSGRHQDIVLHLEDLRALAGANGLFANGILDFTRRVGVPCRIVSLASWSAIVPSVSAATDMAAGPALHESVVATQPSGV